MVVLDRNGLRPARYLITKKWYDGGCLRSRCNGFLEQEISKRKGRLQPGKNSTGWYGKRRNILWRWLKLAEAKPYRIWLSTNRIELDELKSGRKMPHHAENYDRMLRTFGYSKEGYERLIIPIASTGAEPIHSMGNDTPLAVLSTSRSCFTIISASNLPKWQIRQLTRYARNWWCIDGIYRSSRYEYSDT